jgi:hypothetical protein
MVFIAKLSSRIKGSSVAMKGRLGRFLFER